MTRYAMRTEVLVGLLVGRDRMPPLPSDPDSSITPAIRASWDGYYALWSSLCGLPPPPFEDAPNG